MPERAQLPQQNVRLRYQPQTASGRSFYPHLASFLSRETALSDFPHSRQTRLARGVISPQNGHTLCDRTSWVRGLSISSNVPRNSRTDASRRRRVGRYDSIDLTSAGFPLFQPIFGRFEDDRAIPAILCRIAHIRAVLDTAIADSRPAQFEKPSNSDQLFAF